jgi:hypothetical protein
MSRERTFVSTHKLETKMKTRIITRTLFLIALMFNLAVAGVYAQQDPVKMTFSGNGAPSTINLQYPGTTTGEENVAGNSTLGWFTFRNVTASAAAPSPQPPTTCSGPTKFYFPRMAGAGIFRFEDGSLLTVEPTEGGDCIDLVAQEGHCTLTLKITGGTGRFNHASGNLTYAETAKPVLADAFHNPVYFTETGKITGSVFGVAMPEDGADERR